MGPIAKRLRGGCAASAERERSAACVDLLPAGITEGDILTLDEQRTVVSHPDPGHSLQVLAHLLHRREEVRIRLRLAHLIE